MNAAVSAKWLHMTMLSFVSYMKLLWLWSSFAYVVHGISFGLGRYLEFALSTFFDCNLLWHSARWQTAAMCEKWKKEDNRKFALIDLNSNDTMCNVHVNIEPKKLWVYSINDIWNVLEKTFVGIQLSAPEYAIHSCLLSSIERKKNCSFSICSEYSFFFLLVCESV